MTQEQLAEAASLSVDFIGLIERGVNAPSFESIERLANALGVEVVEFFEFTRRSRFHEFQLITVAGCKPCVYTTRAWMKTSFLERLVIS